MCAAIVQTIGICNCMPNVLSVHNRRNSMKFLRWVTLPSTNTKERNGKINEETEIVHDHYCAFIKNDLNDENKRKKTYTGHQPSLKKRERRGETLGANIGFNATWNTSRSVLFLQEIHWHTRQVSASSRLNHRAYPSRELSSRHVRTFTYTLNRQQWM